MSQRNMLEVFETKTGEHRNVNTLLNGDKEHEFKLRRKIKEQIEPIYLCPECFQPVTIKGNSKRETHFAHSRNSPDCPIKTTSQLTREQMLAIKFNGQKEGQRHKENKIFIGDILKADSAFNNVQIEKTFREEKHAGLAKEWRRPDVSADYLPNNKKTIFEIQVSTTFIDVIIGREQFYNRNEAYLMWVFLEFDPNSFTTSDVCYNSFNHVFVLDERAKQLSIEHGKLHLNCHYLEPYINDGGAIDNRWCNEHVPFDSLTFDSKLRKYYYKNTNEMKMRIYAQLQKDIELDDHDKKIEELSVECFDLTKARDSLLLELNNIRGEYTAISNSFETQKRAYDEYLRRDQVIKDNITRNVEKLNQIEANKKTTSNENRELQRKNKQLIDFFENKKASIKNELRSYREEEQNDIDYKIDNSESILEGKRNEYRQLMTQIKNCQDDLKHIESKINQQKYKLSSLVEENKKHEANIADLAKSKYELAEVQNKLRYLSDEKEELYYLQQKKEQIQKELGRLASIEDLAKEQRKLEDEKNVLQKFSNKHKWLASKLFDDNFQNAQLYEIQTILDDYIEMLNLEGFNKLKKEKQSELSEINLQAITIRKKTENYYEQIKRKTASFHKLPPTLDDFLSAPLKV